MIDSIFKKLAIATAGTTLMFTLGEVMPAQAANISYNFSNADQTLTGYFSFDQTAAADQLVEVAEGLKIVANYNGQIFTEADDPLATVWTDFLGQIPTGQGLGLQYVVPDQFFVFGDTYLNADATESQSVNYSRVPEPGSMLGLSIVGLGLFLGRKKQ
ncbi:PEP-CTERM putative exosortase interaction domain-containing protein [Nostoc sp. PCC 7524]|uniref:PEP-CTERM sorting domain-containing protein n=1 Tax=Nostoc sp. (strain ATCC 29411 / PCC 7524) TaxID=28072 RepID=UPI00029F384A|nr:PEP-CTERM sorting domain-containing protein [Nostoc sp. PCC 7524]AFY46562.1 PEP-CTERM putative exosortase interaction domain-containing protein [Nostoc sp. PCC 7524]